ncbi:hypothetical protein K438DRAFT_1760584 [Mycena galopus ATCC 62051]|nr:hypothetical protein K438DRAFT_1760584 [Mycena galopus ATCC 62051]
MTVDKFSLFRIISFSLAGGDVLQTMPDTYRLYRKQWVNGRLSTVCIFYACARYFSIISLVSNGIGFFGTDFTPASCRRFYMLPNVTAMLAGMAAQVLVFSRTFAISGRSKRCFYGLGIVMLLGFPVQVFGITYHRDPFLSNVVSVKEWYFMLGSSPSRFIFIVMRNGILYTATVFLVNLWVVLEFAGVFSTGAASTLPLAVVMIAVQHLILSTQRNLADSSHSIDDLRSPRITPNATTRGSGPLRFFGSQFTQQDAEIQLEPDLLKLSVDRQSTYTPTQRSSNFETEDRSSTFAPDIKSNRLDGSHASSS